MEEDIPSCLVKGFFLNALGVQNYKIREFLRCAKGSPQRFQKLCKVDREYMIKENAVFLFKGIQNATNAGGIRMPGEKAFQEQDGLCWKSSSGSGLPCLIVI